MTLLLAVWATAATVIAGVCFFATYLMTQNAGEYAAKSVARILSARGIELTEAERLMIAKGWNK